MKRELNNVNRAKELLEREGYTCVLCKADTVYTSEERGVKPLVSWLEGGIDLKGFSAADKVVGKAAAFLYALLGVEEVYAHVMSEAAAGTLAENGIHLQYDCCVKRIINRAGTGICPKEEAIGAITQPREALSAIKKRLAELSSGSFAETGKAELADK